MKIYIDGELPESCASCQFIVHCDECEGAENYCPFIGCVGYDLSDDLKDGAPVTPSWERHEECPLVQRPHGEWLKKGTYFGTCWATCSVCNEVSSGEGHDNGFGHDYFYPNFCPKCGSDNRPRILDEAVDGEGKDGNVKEGDRDDCPKT